MRQLEKSLQEWVSQKLISSQQQQAILDYEHSTQKKSFVLVSFISLGVLVMMMGVIAIIASHWYTISDSTKLTSAFLLLLLLAVATFTTYQRESRLAFEALLFAFVLLCLATIGLIGQLFHLSGSVEDSFLFWCTISFSAALFTRKFWLPFFWVSVLIPSMLFKIYDIIYYWFSLHQCVFTLVLTLTPMCVVLLAILFRYLRKVAPYWHKSMVCWSMGMGVVMVILSDILITQSKGMGALLILLTDMPAEQSLVCGPESYLTPAFFLALLSLIWVHASRVFTPYQKTILSMLMAVYLLMNYLALFSQGIPVLGAVMYISLFSLAALYCASANYRYWFHFFTFVIAIRFFFVYLDHFHSLVNTGIGLIVTGALIIGLVVAWKRYSHVLLAYSKELSR